MLPSPGAYETQPNRPLTPALSRKGRGKFASSPQRRRGPAAKTKKVLFKHLKIDYTMFAATFSDRIFAINGG
jgi:hypothetical protein